MMGLSSLQKNFKHCFACSCLKTLFLLSCSVTSRFHSKCSGMNYDLNDSAFAVMTFFFFCYVNHNPIFLYMDNVLSWIEISFSIPEKQWTYKLSFILKYSKSHNFRKLIPSHCICKHFSSSYLPSCFAFSFNQRFNPEPFARCGKYIFVHWSSKSRLCFLWPSG